MVVPSGLVNPAKVREVISETLRDESPWVKSIRFELGQDWTGEWALFFKVLLADAAIEKLLEIARRIRSRISDEVIPNLGLFPYFSFRTESEQATLKDPDWA